MKKNIFKTMLVAAAAMAFASCSKDATTDLAPSRELSGATKMITINAGFAAETRTELTAEHKLLWSEEDVFGILAADAEGVLENIAVAIAEGEKSESGYHFERIEVPAETTTLYCYYPYSASYNNLTDIADFTINIPNFYSNDSAYSAFGHYDETYAGEFLPKYHYMAAAAEVTGEDAEVNFTPLVSIVEFNLYDTTQSGEKFTTFYFTGGGTSKINGEFTVNFDSNTITAKDAEDGVGIFFAKDKALTLPSTKANGKKLYIIVPKGEYAGATFQVGSVDHEFNPAGNGYFNDLEWEKGTSFTADGHTVNIDLKHALPAPLAQPLSFTQVDGNPFFATVPVVVQEACDFFAIRVYDTSDYNKQKNNRNDAGKNQYDQMVEQLYDAYITEYIGNGNSSKIGTYGYAPSPFYPFQGYNDESITDLTAGPRTLMITEDWQLLYDGYWNSDTQKWDRPGHRNVLEPNTSYTFVAYAKARPSAINKYGTDFVVYETEFKTPALQFNGTGTLETEYTQAGGTATVKVTGTNIKKFVYWIVKPAENKPKDPLTSTDLIDAMKNRADVYFKDFDGEYTITQTGMNPGEEYTICVVGVDTDGKLVAAKQVKAKAADIEFNGYEISDVELASQPTKLGEVELTFTVKDSPKYLRIYTGAPRNIDGAAKTDNSDEVQAQTWAEIQGYFKNNSYSANYAEVEVTGNTVTTKISFSEPDQIIPDGEYDYVDNPGHNPFYILIVGTDAKGDAITKLGNIYQIRGEYNDPIVEMCVEDIHRGVKVGDDTHTRTDKTAYFYSCPVEDFDKVEPEEPEEPSADLWATGYAYSTPGLMHMNTGAVYVYAGTAGGKGWIFKLGSKNDHTEWGTAGEYGANDALKAAVKTAISEAFSNYANDGSCSSEYLKHEFSSMPTSTSNGQFASPEWFSDAAIGDVYLIVYETNDELLYGGVKTISGTNVITGAFTIASNINIDGDLMN